MIIKANTYPTQERVNMRGGEGTAHVTPLVETDLPANCRLFSSITLPAGASIGYHTHENECELFYFISGQGQVQDNEQTIDVAAGDTMVTPDGHGHAVINTGNVPLVLLACIILS